MQSMSDSPRVSRFGRRNPARPGASPVPILGALLVLPLLLAACGETTAPPVPASLQKISGDGQEVWTPAAAPEPLVVRVVDGSGAPVPGIPVEWSVTQGSIVGSGLTDADGRASASWYVDFVGSSLAKAAVEGLVPVHFNVSGRVVPIELTEFQVTPDTVNVAEGAALVRFRARARHGEGVGDVLVRLIEPGPILHTVWLTRVEGTDRDGWWEGEAEIPQGAPSGGWDLNVTVAGPRPDDACHCLGYPRVLYPPSALAYQAFSSVVEVVGGS